MGSGQWAVGSGQWAVGSGQWAVGSIRSASRLLSPPFPIRSHGRETERGQYDQFGQHGSCAVGPQPGPERVAFMAGDVGWAGMQRLKGHETIGECRDDKQRARHDQQGIKRVALGVLH